MGVESEKEAKGTETLVLPAWPKGCADGRHLQQGMPFEFSYSRSGATLGIPSPLPGAPGEKPCPLVIRLLKIIEAALVWGTD